MPLGLGLNVYLGYIPLCSNVQENALMKKSSGVMSM